MAKNEEVPELKELKELKSDGIKTVVKEFKNIVKQKLEQLEDMATLEIMMPVHARLRKRMESLRKTGQAVSHKIDGHWKTTPPKMHMRGLQGRKLDNNEAEIKFEVFEIDDKGNKKVYYHTADVELPNGETVQRTTAADYRIAYEVTERIVHRKPITREIIKMEVV